MSLNIQHIFFLLFFLLILLAIPALYKITKKTAFFLAHVSEPLYSSAPNAKIEGDPVTRQSWLGYKLLIILFWIKWQVIPMDSTENFFTQTPNNYSTKSLPLNWALDPGTKKSNFIFMLIKAATVSLYNACL